jgi:hypothetical protein
MCDGDSKAPTGPQDTQEGVLPEAQILPIATT